MNGIGWGDNSAPGMGHNSGETEGWGQSSVEVQAEQLPTFEVKYAAQPATEEPEMFRLRRNAEIDAWLNNKAAQKAATDIERDSRAKVSGTLFPTPKKGTQRYDLGEGYKIKLVHTLKYELGDKDKTDDEGIKIPIETQVRELEQAIIDKHGEIGAQILKRVIAWRPELSGSQYEKLDRSHDVEADVFKMIGEQLTVRPGSPQLDFEEPKDS